MDETELTEVVAHPEDGRPVRRVVSYQDIELQQESDKLPELEMTLNVAQEDLQHLTERHDAELVEMETRVEQAESALKHQKSFVATANDIASAQGGLDSGAVGTGSETENSDPAGTYEDSAVAL